MGSMTTSGEARRSSVRTRAAVLDAAESLFAAHGYRGTSLEEIGREAGLSRGTPGYLFGSKTRLYAEVLGRILARARFELTPAYRQVRPVESLDATGLSAFVRAHLDLLAREPALVRLIQWETLDADALIVLELSSHTGPLVALIQDLSEHLGSTRLDAGRATALLVDVAALCWLPLAYADALKQAVGSDSRGPEALGSQTQRIVAFVLAQLGEQPVEASAGAPKRATLG
jgi:AcrR family transcriptional regulator